MPGKILWVKDLLIILATRCASSFPQAFLSPLFYDDISSKLADVFSFRDLDFRMKHGNGFEHFFLISEPEIKVLIVGSTVRRFRNSYVFNCRVGQWLFRYIYKIEVQLFSNHKGIRLVSVMDSLCCPMRCCLGHFTIYNTPYCVVVIVWLIYVVGVLLLF